MTIAFYKVDNSLNYERHEFDADRPETIIEKLQRLPDGEVKFYDADKYCWQSKEPTLADFETDYNDEQLDGWRMVVHHHQRRKTERKEANSRGNGFQTRLR